jgi:excisionase family DNA binding protein
MLQKSEVKHNSGETLSPISSETLYRHLRSLQEDVHSILAKLNQLDGTDPDALLTRHEAADRLRVSTRTLDDLEASGRLQAIRIGRRVLYHPATLDAFIRQQSREGSK